MLMNINYRKKHSVKFIVPVLLFDFMSASIFYYSII